MLVESIFPTYLYSDIVPFDIDLDYLHGLEYKSYGCGTGYSSANELILEEEYYLLAFNISVFTPDALLRATFPVLEISKIP